MKHKYVVIQKNGKVVKPEAFLRSGDCPSDFRVLVEREALGKRYPDDKKRDSDYINFANKFGFDWEPNADIGFIQYDYKAKLIVRLLYEYARQLVQNLPFPVYEVSGSNFYDMGHPVVDAYARLFGDRLFKFDSDKKALVMSYDSSFPHFNLAGKLRIKESQLPFGHFSLSDCYRFEQRGEMMLLFRGRRFHMADLHPYFRNVRQAFKSYFDVEREIVSAAEAVGRKYVRLAKVSNMKNWDRYKDNIIGIAVRNREPMLVEIRMDGEDRYWIVDVDYSIIDQYRQPREIGCIQIDVGNAERMGIQFKGKSGSLQYPVIIHSAIPGGVERFLYMLFDRFKQSFPLWLHPVQVRLIPVSGKYVRLAEEIAEGWKQGLRIEIDDRRESVSKRIKLSYEDLVPEHIIVGGAELSSRDRVALSLRKVVARCEGYPFIPLSWPEMLSKQVSK